MSPPKTTSQASVRPLGLRGCDAANRAWRAEGNTHGLAIYIEKGAKLGMKALGLHLAISMAVGFAPHASAVGCQYDMQCKGERICEQGQCVSSEQPARVPPATRNVPAPGQPAKAPPAMKNVPASGQPAKALPATRNVPAPEHPIKAPAATKNVPTPEQPATASPAMTNVPALSTEFRYCCTKVGKFPLDREPNSEEDIAVNRSNTCHGITSYGTPLPGTPCN